MAAPHRDRSGYGAQRGRLACPVGAEQGNDRAFGHGDRDVDSIGQPVSCDERKLIDLNVDRILCGKELSPYLGRARGGWAILYIYCPKS